MRGIVAEVSITGVFLVRHGVLIMISSPLLFRKVSNTKSVSPLAVSDVRTGGVTEVVPKGLV